MRWRHTHKTKPAQQHRKKHFGKPADTGTQKTGLNPSLPNPGLALYMAPPLRPCDGTCMSCKGYPIMVQTHPLKHVVSKGGRLPVVMVAAKADTTAGRKAATKAATKAVI